MHAIFIGSLSTLADTSELQRAAFNQSFAEAGLDWHWAQDDYRDMLRQSGGRDRIAAYAQTRGQEVDAQALHDRKTAILQENLTGGAAQLRDQTQAMLEYARTKDLPVAFVSGTARETLEALLSGFGGARALGIHLITAQGDAAPKPDPALYELALSKLSLAAEDVLAVEDNVPGYEAATAAGIHCLTYPNANTADHDFGNAEPVNRWTAYLRQD